MSSDFHVELARRKKAAKLAQWLVANECDPEELRKVIERGDDAFEPGNAHFANEAEFWATVARDAKCNAPTTRESKVMVLEEVERLWDKS